MATLGEASSSSSSSSTNTSNFDVFLSFRGIDTRLSITSHLHKALVDANLKTFSDVEDIKIGEYVVQASVSAIKASRLSVVVLSKNYAYSTRCLDELVLILEQRKHSNQIVIPIFYHVQPTDVRNQQSTFRGAMEKHIQRLEGESDAEKRSQWVQKIEMWKAALVKVANISGFLFENSRPEVEIIEEAVNNIRSLLTRYDVFLSFYDPDTRLSFTGHLHKALEDANLKTFFYDEIVEGANLNVEMYSPIRASSASVIVLSKNYASSSDCLDELVMILEQHRSSNHIVIPIFHHVEPAHVIDQLSSFGMEKHLQKIGEWKKALTDVANLSGHHTDIRIEPEIIEAVIAEIYQKLGVVSSSTKSEYFIGMDDHVGDIITWLDDSPSHSIDILTIFGIAGSGKTSLAKHVYERRCHLFDRNSFIQDISKCSEQSDKLLILQKQLFSQISEQSSLQVNDVPVYTAMIQKALQGKKVLLVLDDVNSLDQLTVLLGNKGFHSGSKIIITTRDASLTNRYLVFNPLDQPKHTTLSLKGLDDTSSLQLFCLSAFNLTGPRKDYEQVCKKIVTYCEGHPLALKVMGSNLCGQLVAEWEAYIEKLKHKPDSTIQKALQVTYESLSYQKDKELFLHIACFFVEMDRDVTETILDACDIITVHGISTLIERSLLTIGPTNKLMMHPLLQEMGRDVVCQESPKNPGKRSRLCCHEESLKVLREKQGSANLLGLTLDMKQEEKKLHELVEIETDAFSKMENLMLLQLNYVQLKGSYESFPEELRWLCMHGFPSKSMPSDIPMENLVALDLSYGKIEVFDMSSNDERFLGSLKILNLSFCEQLHTVGGFVVLPALENFNVSNCTGLIKVSESIEHCVELVTIDLSYCNKLEALPRNLEKLKKLKTLLLDGCDLVYTNPK